MQDNTHSNHSNQSSQTLLQKIIESQPTNIDQLEKIIGPLNRNKVVGPSAEVSTLSRSSFSSQISNLSIQFVPVDIHHQDPFSTFNKDMLSYRLVFLNVDKNFAPKMIENNKYFSYENSALSWSLKNNNTAQLDASAKKHMFDKLLSVLKKEVSRENIEKEFGQLDQNNTYKEAGWSLILSVHDSIDILFDSPISAKEVTQNLHIKNPIASSTDIHMSHYVITNREGLSPKISSSSLEISLNGVGEKIESPNPAIANAELGDATVTSMQISYDNEKIAIIKPQNFSTALVDGRRAIPFNPDDEQIKIVEKKLGEYLSLHHRNLHKKYKNYYRQYTGLEIVGDSKFIRGNFMCEVLSTSWQTDWIETLDGGDCYFKFSFDVIKSEIKNLIINGEA